MYYALLHTCGLGSHKGRFKKKKKKKASYEATDSKRSLCSFERDLGVGK